jgi:hypothetical protein
MAQLRLEEAGQDYPFAFDRFLADRKRNQWAAIQAATPAENASGPAECLIRIWS